MVKPLFPAVTYYMQLCHLCKLYFFPPRKPTQVAAWLMLFCVCMWWWCFCLFVCCLSVVFFPLTPHNDV